ncbi:MAG: glycosyltransferase family 2 protein [Leptospiraceae bacterium]|nr:glycosyltransferase family 2 protein [Leptospiraceae bacterium]
MQKVLVVIPAHNEAETIAEVVERTLAYADVSVTDDGSRDSTPAILERLLKESDQGRFAHKLHVITHPRATHIPQGIQDGMRYATGKSYDWVITMDAGLSHDPDALPAFLAADARWDVVIGSRQKVENVPAYRRLISWMAARVVNYALSPGYFNLFGPGLRDCTSGYRRYSARAARLIARSQLESRAFDFHMEALALCCRQQMKATEIPIHYVFSNSSFNSRVLKQAMRFGLHLIATKSRKTDAA